MEAKTTRAPVLTQLGEEDVRSWAKQYEAYVKRGGLRRARECVDDDVLDAIALFGVEVKAAGDGAAEQREDDEKFLRALRAIYAAPDKDAARAELAAVLMPAEFTTDVVADFILEFTKAVKAHGEGVAELGEENVRDIFLDSIQVKVVRKRVKGSSPTSWQAAAKDLMQRARDHEAKAKEVELLAAATRQVGRKVNVKTRASRVADGEESPPIGKGSAPVSGGADTAAPGISGSDKEVKGTNRKCYRCGETGHLARDCKLSEQEGRDRLRAEAGSTRETRADTAVKTSLLKCHKCGSQEHYTRQCPRSAPESGQVLAIQAVPRTATTASRPTYPGATEWQKLGEQAKTNRIRDFKGRTWAIVNMGSGDSDSDSD
jgi:DNA-directed RNA polymerase subunit M/transcription elongation factor TFIIS